jgi:hypothetical protein
LIEIIDLPAVGVEMGSELRMMKAGPITRPVCLLCDRPARRAWQAAAVMQDGQLHYWPICIRCSLRHGCDNLTMRAAVAFFDRRHGAQRDLPSVRRRRGRDACEQGRPGAWHGRYISGRRLRYAQRRGRPKTGPQGHPSAISPHIAHNGNSGAANPVIASDYVNSGKFALQQHEAELGRRVTSRAVKHCHVLPGLAEAAKLHSFE